MRTLRLPCASVVLRPSCMVIILMATVSPRMIPRYTFYMKNQN